MSGVIALAVGRGFQGTFLGQSIACMARKGNVVSSANLKIRGYEADEIRADLRESFLRSKHAKRLGDMAK